jgi:hypothetical protein
MNQQATDQNRSFTCTGPQMAKDAIQTKSMDIIDALPIIHISELSRWRLNDRHPSSPSHGCQDIASRVCGAGVSRAYFGSHKSERSRSFLGVEQALPQTTFRCMSVAHTGNQRIIVLCDFLLMDSTLCRCSILSTQPDESC